MDYNLSRRVCRLAASCILVYYKKIWKKKDSKYIYNYQGAVGMPRPGPGSAFFIFLGSGPRPKDFFVGPGSIFSFNQIHFDFSLKSKFNGAKVNV
jgi:hypothetical protein